MKGSIAQAWKAAKHNFISANGFRLVRDGDKTTFTAYDPNGKRASNLPRDGFINLLGENLWDIVEYEIGEKSDV